MSARETPDPSASTKPGRLNLSIGPFESVIFTLPDGREIVVGVSSKAAKMCRLCLIAPRDINIRRVEHGYCDHTAPLPTG